MPKPGCKRNDLERDLRHDRTAVSPDDVLARAQEREARDRADNRTPAQVWLGDPPAWRSALALHCKIPERGREKLKIGRKTQTRKAKVRYTSRTMTETALTLVHASKSRGGVLWSKDDYDVHDGERRVIGRIMLHPQAPKSRPWCWTITARGRIASLADSGYAANREQALADFKARWEFK